METQQDKLLLQEEFLKIQTIEINDIPAFIQFFFERHPQLFEKIRDTIVKETRFSPKEIAPSLHENLELGGFYGHLKLKDEKNAKKCLFEILQEDWTFLVLLKESIAAMIDLGELEKSTQDLLSDPEKLSREWDEDDWEEEICYQLANSYRVHSLYLYLTNSAKEKSQEVQPFAESTELNEPHKASTSPIFSLPKLSFGQSILAGVGVAIVIAAIALTVAALAFPATTIPALLFMGTTIGSAFALTGAVGTGVGLSLSLGGLVAAFGLLGGMIGGVSHGGVDDVPEGVLEQRPSDKPAFVAQNNSLGTSEPQRKITENYSDLFTPKPVRSEAIIKAIDRVIVRIQEQVALDAQPLVMRFIKKKFKFLELDLQNPLYFAKSEDMKVAYLDGIKCGADDIVLEKNPLRINEDKTMRRQPSLGSRYFIAAYKQQQEVIARLEG